MTRNYATFQSTFPDEAEESDGGILVPAGSRLAMALAANVPGATPPYQHSFYGWKFEFRCKSRRDAWAIVQYPKPWLLIVEAKRGWFEWGGNQAQANEEAIEVVQPALVSVPGVIDVCWHSREEYESL